MIFAAEFGGLRHHPLDLIAHDHALQQQLCDMLEAIADGLPDDIDRRQCREVVAALKFDLPLHHRDEEQCLFPLLLERGAATGSLAEVLDRLADEHATDEGFAGEVVESLEALIHTGTARNPGMLGYMLRGFFEGYRRHIHWENVLVMPAARQYLTADDLQRLSRCMAGNRIAAKSSP
ncbi:MAG: hemerythrin domain-containing protein [Hyphomicrobiales bacterium]